VLLLAAVAVVWLGGCRTPSAPPTLAPIEPLSTRAAIMPTDGDLAAADLAAAVLVDDRIAGVQALGRIVAYEEALHEESRPSGLPGYGQYALASTLDDPIRFRQSLEHLLDSDDLDPGLREVVQQDRDDDPLKLARARVRDSWVRHLGTLFNYFSAPIGKSAATGAVAFVGLARALVRAVLYEAEREAMDLPERQALQHWRRFVEEHPDADKTPEVIARIEDNQKRWNELQRDRAIRGGRNALERNQPRIAYVLAQRALHYREEDPEAMALRDEASRKVERWRDAREATDSAPRDPEGVAAEVAHDLAVTLLAGDDALPYAEALFDADPDGPLADEAFFVMGMAIGENGDRPLMWRVFEELATLDFADSNMSRHAEAAVISPDQNPWRAFDRSRSKDMRNQAAWVLFGPLAKGPRDRDLPRPVEWLVDLPTFVEMFTSLPNRLVFFPWMQPWPFGRAPATFGRRYLEQEPDGPHVEEVAAWLQAWEGRRGNHVGALEAARLRPGIGAGELGSLDEKAAKQKLDAASREPRADLRLSLLKGIARDHPGTKPGREAGEQARELVQTLTPQRIRLSHGFLLEHPHLAGPDGIGLDSIYLDDEPRNGELHPEGVSLVGDRTLELSFLAASGDPDDPPERRYRTISEEKMARLVSLLDETSLRLAQLDRDYEHRSDPERDRFFEHARLGVSAGPAVSAAARSDFAFRGMRETYGIVRSRESILPFELVVQGSLYDFGFGVFPRIRMPKPTPDSFLYK
jgi:hypothetical protein